MGRQSCSAKNPDEESSKSLWSVLEGEFRRLQKLIPLEEVTHVRLEPMKENKVLGEVTGDTVLVYSDDREEALRVLKHEYLDCLLSRRLIDPLVAVINVMIKIRENEIYQSKEKIVNLLSNFVGTTQEGV